MTLEGMSDEELCRGAAAGRRDHFNELFDRHHQAVYRFCLLKAGESEARDAAQEIFIALWRNAEGFQGRSTFKGWLFGISYRKCMDIHRKTTDTLELKDESPIPPSSMSNSGIPPDEAIEVRQALRRLPEGLREAVFLIYYRGFSYDEAAETLGIPVGTVKSRLNTAKRSLLEALSLREETMTG